MPDNILNNATTPDGTEGDGVALQSTRHPPNITDNMIAAGLQAFQASVSQCQCDVVTSPTDMLRAVYEAMFYAEPVLPDISDDAFETVQVEYYLPDEAVERFAIRSALGNNGGEWKEHYKEGHREFWRKYIRDLAEELRKAHRLRMVRDDAGTEF